VWAIFTSKLGVQMQLTTPYHPQTNGVVERFRHRLKDSLRAWLAGLDWIPPLPWVLLGLRAAPREDSSISAAKLVYGLLLSLPVQFLTAAKPPPTAFVQQLRFSLSCVSDKVHSNQAESTGIQKLQEAAYVLIGAPPMSLALSPAYHGSYRVRAPGARYFVLEVSGKR
jgi:hypothetical protein